MKLFNILSKKCPAILLVSTIFYMAVRTFYSNNDISPDSLNYLQQANFFWNYKSNFPLGYPFTIWVVSSVTFLNTIIAAKIINLFCYFLPILHSWKNKFYFKEILLLFSFYPFATFYGSILSEPMFYALLYAIVFTINKFFVCTKNYFFVFFILFFCLTSVRFTGVFVAIGTCLFLTTQLLFDQTKPKPQTIKSIIAVVLGCITYLLVNYMYCGHPMGERSHLEVSQNSVLSFLGHFSLKFLEDFSILNFLEHKGMSMILSRFNVIFGFVLLAIGVFLFLRSKNSKLDLFLITLFGTTLTLTLYSYYTTQIDDNIRIKSLSFFFLIFYIFKKLKEKLVLFYIVIFCHLANSTTYFTHSSETISSKLKTSNYIENTFINCKNVKILYPPNDAEIKKRHSKVLLFKALLIDKKIECEEIIGSSSNYENRCDISFEKITKL